MGAAFLRSVFRSTNPRVGLLSNAEEEIKGNELTRKTHALLKESSINYIGYVEGKDIFLGDVNIVVCDGFVGNTLLKMGEVLVELFPDFVMKRALESSEIVHYLPTLNEFCRLFKKGFDYTEYGGAPLLGVRGVCLIGHGRSDARAVKNAIKTAAEFARAQIAKEVEKHVCALAG